MEARSASSPCENCGGTFLWDAAARRLRCGGCGELRDGPDPGEVPEHDLGELVADYGRKRRGRLGAGPEIAICDECGAEVEFPEGLVATRCSFCSSPKVHLAAARADRLLPESIIPFRVATDEARRILGRWLAGGWFRRSDLGRRAVVTELRGVYLPHWTFSAEVTSSWTADAGYHYPVREGDKMVQRTRWRPAHGRRHDRIDDHLVCASAGFRRRVEFETSELVAFSPDYLLGFAAEGYALDLPEAWKRAQREIASEQKGRCGGDVPGDTHRSLRASHRFDDVTVKHALLPLWIAAYRYNGKVYQALVNGQTARASGQAPLSWVKIASLVLLVLAVVAAVLYFRR